jgi:glycosyltransferase involved in cell wall biosynthesis
MVGRLADRVVAISHAVAENVMGGARANGLTVVPNAVEAGFFEPAGSREACRLRLGLRPGVPLVGVPGTLRPMKGHEFFLNAAVDVLSEIPDCHFGLTGHGEASYRAELERQVRRLGIGARVRFLGTLEDMRAFYAACDVACIPSRAEPFGRVVIEAFAAGVPVVASAVGGIRETVSHECNGLLVRYGDVGGLAAALVRLLTDEACRARLAEQAAKDAREHYHEEAYQRRIQGIVEDLLDEPGRGRQTDASRQPVEAV